MAFDRDLDRLGAAKWRKAIFEVGEVRGGTRHLAPGGAALLSSADVPVVSVGGGVEVANDWLVWGGAMLLRRGLRPDQIRTSDRG